MAEEKNIPEEEENLPEEEKTSPEQEKPVKSSWQATKESWYDKVPLTLKQLDIIVGICFALLALTFVAIILEALGIWSLFG